MRKNKISNGQFFSLLLLTRLSEFFVMPITSAGVASLEERILGILLSAGIEVILSIPLICYLSRRVESGKVSKILTSLFFVLSSAEVTSRFCAFMDKEYPHVASPWVIALLFLAVGGYLSCLGIEGIARSSTVILTALLVACVAVGVLSFGKGEILNIDPVTENNGIIVSLVSHLSVSRSLALAFSLSGNLKYGSSKFLFLGAITAPVLEALALSLCAFSMGKYVSNEGFIISAFSEYARSDVVHHFSSVMMALAAASTAVTLGAFINRAADGRKSYSLLCALATAALSLIMLRLEIWLRPIFSLLLGVVILGIVMPTVDYIRRRKCEKSLLP